MCVPHFSTMGSEAKLGPSLYRVVMHDDKKTDMACMVEVLKSAFKKTTSSAILAAKIAKEESIVVVDIMAFEHAEFRVEKARSMAEAMKSPLILTMEKV